MFSLEQINLILVIQIKTQITMRRHIKLQKGNKKSLFQVFWRFKIGLREKQT